MAREKLPDRRFSVTRKVKLNGFTAHYTVGFYPDGRPGDLFIDLSRCGSAIQGWARTAAVLVSRLLQHGATTEEVVHAVRDLQTDCPTEIHGVMTTGILDLIVKLVHAEYSQGGRDEATPGELREMPPESSGRA